MEVFKALPSRKQEFLQSFSWILCDAQIHSEGTSIPQPEKSRKVEVGDRVLLQFPFSLKQSPRELPFETISELKVARRVTEVIFSPLM